MALAKSSQWQQFVEVVDQSETKVIDTIKKANIYSGGYHLNVRNADNTLSKTLKVVLNRSETSLVKESVYTLLGDVLDVEVSTNINGSDFELIMKNNELFPVTVTIQRSIL